MALTDKQEEKVHVCETNLVRRTVGAKRADKGKTDELFFKKELARSSLTWAGHAETMGDEELEKRADAQKLEGKIGKRRPKLRMGDCLKET